MSYCSTSFVSIRLFFYYLSFSFLPYEATRFTAILVGNIRCFVNFPHGSRDHGNSKSWCPSCETALTIGADLRWNRRITWLLVLKELLLITVYTDVSVKECYLGKYPFLSRIIRSTTSQILTIRRILEGVRAKNLQVTLIFVDFTKAFDSIHRGKMEQILLAYGIPKETVAAITILYRNTKVKVRSPDGDTEYFDIVAGVLQGDTLAPYLFIICLDYVLRTSIDKIKENGFELTKKRSRSYPATTITDADYADDIAILANTPDQAETLLHSLERAINRLSIIWKSDLTDKMKRSFFQTAVTSILLYGCTTWTLTKRLEKKLDGNYTRMLRAILNKSWRQHPTKHQLYGHLPPITKTIQVRRARHAGHCWRSRDELIRDVLLWTPTHGRAKAGRPARTYIQQLCEDTGCCPEDLPRAMYDREEWRERVRDIRATSAIWWWYI